MISFYIDRWMNFWSIPVILPGRVIGADNIWQHVFLFSIGCRKYLSIPIRVMNRFEQFPAIIIPIDDFQRDLSSSNRYSTCWNDGYIWAIPCSTYWFSILSRSTTFTAPIDTLFEWSSDLRAIFRTIPCTAVVLLSNARTIGILFISPIDRYNVLYCTWWNDQNARESSFNVTCMIWAIRPPIIRMRYLYRLQLLCYLLFVKS